MTSSAPIVETNDRTAKPFFGDRPTMRVGLPPSTEKLEGMAREMAADILSRPGDQVIPHTTAEGGRHPAVVDRASQLYNEQAAADKRRREIDQDIAQGMDVVKLHGRAGTHKYRVQDQAAFDANYPEKAPQWKEGDPLPAGVVSVSRDEHGIRTTYNYGRI